MAGTITALEVQKRNPQRVSVYLDGRFAFGLAAIYAAHLRVGQPLSDQEIARLQEQDAAERATERALELLSYRPRSQEEVRRRLRRKRSEDGAIEEAVGRLTRTRLLDDREFARYWIENRWQFNPRGVAILRRELQEKGVDDTVIEEALVGYDEEAAAARVAATVARRLNGLERAAFRRRLTEHLVRRGFPYTIIEPLVQQALAGHEPGESGEEGET